MEFSMFDNTAQTGAGHSADDSEALNSMPDFTGQGLEITLPLRTLYPVAHHELVNQRSSIWRASKNPTTAVVTPAPLSGLMGPSLQVQGDENRAVAEDLDEFMNQVSTSIEEEKAAEEARSIEKKRAIEATKACLEKIKARQLALREAKDEATKLALQEAKDNTNRREHAIEEEYAKNLALQAAKDGVNRSESADEQEHPINERWRIQLERKARTAERKRTQEDRKRALEDDQDESAIEALAFKRKRSHDQRVAHSRKKKNEKRAFKDSEDEDVDDARAAKRRSHEVRLANWQRRRKHAMRAFEDGEGEVVTDESQAEYKRPTKKYRLRKKQHDMGKKQAYPDADVMFTVKEALVLFKMNEEAGFPLELPRTRTRMD